MLKPSHTFQELIGAGDEVDKQWFLDVNYPNENEGTSKKVEIIQKGKEIIDLILREFQKIFLEEYEKIMIKVNKFILQNI